MKFLKKNLATILVIIVSISLSSCGQVKINHDLENVPIANDPSEKDSSENDSLENNTSKDNSQTNESLSMDSIDILDGYTNLVSYSVGETQNVMLNASNYALDKEISLYTINGDIVDTINIKVAPQTISTNEPWSDGFGYSTTFSYTIPNIKSGIYLWDNKIPFVVRGTGQEEITVVYPSNTINAYNTRGGKSLYSTNRAVQVSFQRPSEIQKESIDFFQFLDFEYDKTINYIADIDLDNYNNFSNSYVLVIPGHNEYWTRTARKNFDKFVNRGGNAAIFSGNTMWWQVRYSEDLSQMICYKSYADDPIKNKHLRTTVWFDEDLNYPIIDSIAVDFNYGGYGNEFSDLGWNGFKIILPHSPLLEGTGLKQGDIIDLFSNAQNCVSEYDGTYIKDFDNQGYPIIDIDKLGFYKAELIGFDYAYRFGDNVASFLVFQKKSNSGIIVNAATTLWGSPCAGLSEDDPSAIKMITKNVLDKLLMNENVFSQ